MISVVINADTRQGWKNESTTVGEFGGDLLGTRSADFLTEGLKNKMGFFRGHETQCILYIDEHESIPDELFMEISELVKSYGNNSKLICRPHDRGRHRWYDYITLEALRLAEGDYVVHFDNDSNAFRSDESDIIEKYFKWLDSEYKYVCTSIPAAQKEKWFWASTQFFICKKETLNFSEIENCFDNRYLEKQYKRISYEPYPCCLEHTIGLMVKDGQVLYPPREDNYMIFCWWKYTRGILKELNEMPYNEARDYILKSGATASSW